MLLPWSWKVRGSNPGGARFSAPIQTGSRGPPSLLYNGYRVFPGGKGGRGVMLTTHTLLVPRLRKSWAIPPLTLWVLLGLLRGSLYLFITLKHECIDWYYQHNTKLCNIQNVRKSKELFTLKGLKDLKGKNITPSSITLISLQKYFNFIIFHKLAKNMYIFEY